MTFRKSGCVNFSFAVWPVALLLLLTAAVPAFSQSSTGTILGVVRDAQGGAVTGANVTIRNTDTGLVRSLKTIEDGAYRAPQLPVGNYSVKIEMTGFKGSTHEGLVLAVAQEMAVNFDLEVGQQTQEVVVTGEAPQVETSSGTLGGLVTEEKIADLPLNGRNYIDLTLLQVGVNQARMAGSITSPTAGTWFSSNGAPPRSNNITLDGTRLNNSQGATSASPGGNTLGVDGIREYKVITDMFGAEYGLGMGSQVAIVSKGGTNRWSGDVFEYLRNDKLDSATHFDRIKIAKKQLDKIPPLRRNNFGGAFGGPIKKDKAFFYAVYEGLRQNLGSGAQNDTWNKTCYTPESTATNYTFLHDVPASCVGTVLHVSDMMYDLATIFPYPNADPSDPLDNQFVFKGGSNSQENYGQLRFDQNISDADAFFTRFTTNRFNASTIGIFGQGHYTWPHYSIDQAGWNQFATIGESHVFSPSLLNSIRIGFARTNVSGENVVNKNSPYVLGLSCPAMNCGPTSGVTGGFSLLNGLPTGGVEPGDGGPAAFGPSGGNLASTIQNIYTLSDDIFYTRGKHALKFGFLVNRFTTSLSPGAGGGNSVAGEVVFGDPQSFLLSDGTSSVVNAPANWNATSRTKAPYFVFSTLGFYVQDDVRANSRLTLNLGLRYEVNTVPNETHGLNYRYRDILHDPLIAQSGPIMQNASLHNFSPRLGFAYDVTGNGKTAVRGGFGLYYDTGNVGNAIAQYFFGIPPLSSFYNVNPGDGSKFTVPFCTPGACTAGPQPGPESQALHTIDFHSQQPKLYQYNLTVEHQLPLNMAFSLGYVGSRGSDLFYVTEQNPNVPITGNCVDPKNPTNAAVAGPQFCPGGNFWGTQLGQSTRANKNFGTAFIISTGAQSWYNALQATLNMKMFHGLQFQTSYTYSQTLDNTQGMSFQFDCANAWGSGQRIDPFNGDISDKGPSCFDVPHNLRVNFLYRLPGVKSTGFLSKIVNGWWVGSLVSMQSGYPFEVSTNGLLSNNGVFASDQGERPNLVTSANLLAAQALDSAAVIYDHSKVITGNPAKWYNVHMYTLAGQNGTTACNTDDEATPPSDFSYPYGQTQYFDPSCYKGFLGNEPRNDLRGPQIKTWDLSFNKDTAVPFLGENGRVQFRAEFFNILNHTNYAMPTSRFVFDATDTTGGPSGNAGSIRDVITSARQIQLALKIVF